MNIQKINPYLRRINLYQCKSRFYSGIRRMYNPYFLYVHKGKGIISIDGVEYVAIAGDLFYVEASVSNSILADREDPFLLTGIDFDFTDEFSNEELLYPIDEGEYNEKNLTQILEFDDFIGFKPKINIANDDEIHKIILMMVENYEKQRRYYKGFVSGLLKSFIFRVAQSTVSVGDGQKNRSLLEEVVEYLNINYKNEITNKEISKKFNYSQDYINRLVLNYSGLSIRQYIINRRIREAIHLLMDTDYSIKEISNKIGVLNVNYFYRLFKQKTGQSPGAFRKNIKGVQNEIF